MPLEWTDSSARHSIAREDALYPIAHAAGSAELEGRSGETTMVYVGHPHGQTDQYIEVIVAQRHPRTMGRLPRDGAVGPVSTPGERRGVTR